MADDQDDVPLPSHPPLKEEERSLYGFRKLPDCTVTLIQVLEQLDMILEEFAVPSGE